MPDISKSITKLLFLGVIIIVSQLSITHYKPYSHATFILGILVLTGFFAGRISQYLRLPAITGYLLSGLILGPYFTRELFDIKGVITIDNISSLNLINNIALGLIAFTAGGELNFERLRSSIFDLLKISLYQLVIIFSGVSVVTGIILSFLPLTSDLPLAQIIVFSILAGCTSTAISPATTIAVIQECGSKGEVSETVLGITIIKDILVITFFAVTLSTGITILNPEHSFDYFFFGTLIWKLAGSFLIGVFFGWALCKYIASISTELPIVVVTIGFLSVEAGTQLHLSGLLICLVAGAWVENLSSHGKKLIKATEHYSLPVYIIFFAISGASINLTEMRVVWPIAIAMVISRLVFTMLSTRYGIKRTGGSKNLLDYTWTGCLGQAGVTLGFSVAIQNSLPEIGTVLATVIVAGVGINQIIGPVIFRYGLDKSGEINA